VTVNTLKLMYLMPQMWTNIPSPKECVISQNFMKICSQVFSNFLDSQTEWKMNKINRLCLISLHSPPHVPHFDYHRLINAPGVFYVGSPDDQNSIPPSTWRSPSTDSFNHKLKTFYINNHLSLLNHTRSWRNCPCLRFILSCPITCTM